MGDAGIVVAVEEPLGVASRHLLGVFDEASSIGASASLWRTPPLCGQIVEELFADVASVRRR